MADLLSLIAQPKVADIPGAIARKQKSSLEQMLLGQQIKQSQAAEKKSLQDVATAEKLASAKAGVSEAVKKGDRDIIKSAIAEFAVQDPDGADTLSKLFEDTKDAELEEIAWLQAAALNEADPANREILLGRASEIAENNPFLKTSIDRIRKTEGPAQTAELLKNISLAQQIGLMKVEPTGEFKERELSVSEGNLEVARQNVLLRTQELIQQGNISAAKQELEKFEQQFGTLEAGFMRDPDDPTKVIPQTGSKEDVKRKEKEVAAGKQIRSQVQQLDNVMRSIDQVLPELNNLTAGFGGTILSKIPGTEAVNVKRALENVAGNVGFNKLMEMKQESATGASGLGQLSNQELRFLQSIITSLSQDQTPERLRDNLNKVKELFTKNRALISEDLLPTGAEDLTGMQDGESGESVGFVPTISGTPEQQKAQYNRLKPGTEYFLDGTKYTKGK